MMKITAIARIDNKTKNLVKRLNPGDIAIISHKDIDELSVEALIEKKVSAVINLEPSISGRYYNTAPYLLIERGIPLIDNVGNEIINKVFENDLITIEDNIILKNNEIVGKGIIQNKSTLSSYNLLAKKNLDNEIEHFVENTLTYIKKEKEILSKHLTKIDIGINFKNKHVLVVVRGRDYKKDFLMLRPYIREKKPILIGVDGGADTILEFGFKPDIILGDMDSVSDKALNKCKKIIVHAYENGKSPGLERLNKLGIKPIVIPFVGTSEDLALTLSFEKGSELIVVIGSHFSLEEFLSKGREGMSSTFLTRLKVGSKLIDAKGVNNLYKSNLPLAYFLFMFLAISFPLLVVIFYSPIGNQFIRLFKMILKTTF